MKLAFTAYRTTGLLGKKQTQRLSDETYPLEDGAAIYVKELKVFVKSSCCPMHIKPCHHCVEYGNLFIPRSFLFHFKNNEGKFTCNDNSHPSIYVNGGKKRNKIELDEVFETAVDTVIYIRKPLGSCDDPVLEFRVVALDEREHEIVEDVETETVVNIECTNADTEVDEDVDIADIVDGEGVDVDAKEAESLKTPNASTPIPVASVTFAVPMADSTPIHTARLLAFEETPSTSRSVLDPPVSSTKGISQKDPAGKSPLFRFQSPEPIRSPLPVNTDTAPSMKKLRTNPNAKHKND
ncbi:MAG: hypothetical protein ACI90V_012751 [Bacillariaceae sp.]|jgi:hypothetical protein